jgi:hypothetical protein
MKSVRSRLLIMLVLAAVAVPAFWTSAQARACARGSSSIRAAATSTTVTRSGVRPGGFEGEPDVPQKLPPVLGHSADAPPVQGPDDSSTLALLQMISRIWMARYLWMR